LNIFCLISSAIFVRDSKIDGKVLLADPEESDKDEAAAEKHDEQVDKAKESQKRHLEAASLGCQKPPR
jgi:hypothetical protein